MSKNRHRKSAKVHGYRPPQSSSGRNQSVRRVWFYGLGSALVILALAAYWLTREKTLTSWLTPEKTLTTASGLKYVDQVVGSGAGPSPGKRVKIHYTGTLENGTKFDSSVDRGQPYEFVIGQGAVIKGWDEGVMSMKVGGKRKLIIPPNLGYGATGNGAIPANSTLLFDVELIEVK